MLIFPKNDFKKFNLGIIVPPRKPHDVFSFLCWFSFFKFLPKVKPIIFVAGNPPIDFAVWARKLNFPVYYIHNCFNPNILSSLDIWEDSYVITLSNVFCMRKFNLNKNFDSDSLILRSKNPDNQEFVVESIEKNKYCHAASWNIGNNFEEVRDTLINNIALFRNDKSLNQIKLESIWSDAKYIRTLLNQEVRHEEI
jgi:hypothetical protein